MAPTPHEYPEYILAGFPRNKFGRDFAAAGPQKWPRRQAGDRPRAATGVEVSVSAQLVGCCLWGVIS